MWLVWGGLGALVGGFLNVLISRLPYETRLFATPLRSHTCGHPLAFLDYFPVVGYVLQRGRCRYCGGRIPPRMVLVELATAALFALAFARFGFGLDLVVVSLYLSVLVVVFVVDQEHRLILNAVTYPAAAIALALSALLPGASLSASLWGALVYGGFFVLLYLLAVLIYRRADALGMGDVKLAILIGLMTGLPVAVVAMLAGILLGALAGVAVLISGRSARDAMPYGTALSVGAMLAILYGDAILTWYIGK